MEDVEIVISGIGGTFPCCKRFEDLKELLKAKRCLSQNNPRDNVVQADSTWHIAPMTDELNFDNTFFGITGNLCEISDPTTKKLLEATFESIVDAGINPKNLRNSKTAVIMATGPTDWEVRNDTAKTEMNCHRILGQAKSMDSNRVSFCFGFRGPSFTMITGEAGVIGAINNAVSFIKKGLVQQAIVGSAHVILLPSVHYDKQLHVFSKDGQTKSFSDDADGYWKSEGAVVYFLQKKSDAFRSYATIEKVDYASIMDPSSHRVMDHSNMKEFLDNFYANEKVDDIGVVIAEGVGIPNVDAQELNCIESAIASKRKEPLPVTSCKSILGHSDCLSPLYSILSAIIALQTNDVVPVINFTKPNRNVRALVDGSIRIVTEDMQLNSNRVAVNAFAMMWNEYGHIILQRTIEKKPEPVSNIPFFVVVSGREENLLRDALATFKNRKSAGAVALAHKAFSQRMNRHTFRGYTTLSDDLPIIITKFDLPKPKPLWFIYSGMGSQWCQMGKELMNIKLFADSIQKCHDRLTKEGINLIEIISTKNDKIFDNILHSFVGITAIQIALTDVLTAIGIHPDGLIGHSVGELGCSYADGCLTWEQTLLAAHARGKASNDAKLIRGMMAAVGVGYQDIKDKLPEEVEVACHNSSTSCTLSGPAEIMENYVKELKGQNIFAKLVNVSNIAYHSKNIKPAAPFLQGYLDKVIPEPKKRSSKWISTSVPEERWNTPQAQLCSANYHTNNLLSYVYFEEGCRHVPKDAICVEIAPHGLLQAIVRRSLPECTHIPITNRTSSNPIIFLFNALGMMYVNGVDMDLSYMYPSVEFPVPCDTWCLQQLVTWQHHEKWSQDFFEMETTEQSVIRQLSLNPNEREMYKMHLSYTINQQSLIPFSYMLVHVLKIFHKITETKFMLTPVLIQDLMFWNLEFPDKEVKCIVTVLRNGKFEVVGNDKPLLYGTITELMDSSPYVPRELPDISMETVVELSEQQIYSYFEDFSYKFKGPFRNINSLAISDQGFYGQMKVFGEVEYKIDALLSSLLFYHLHEYGTPVMPSKIQSIAIEPELLTYGEEAEMVYDKASGNLVTDGISIINVRMDPIEWKPEEFIEISRNTFVPYHSYQPKDETEFYEVCSQFIIENSPQLPDSDMKSILSLTVKDNAAKIPIQLHHNLCKHVKCKARVLSLSGILINCKKSKSSFTVTYEGSNVPPQLHTLLMTSSAFLFLHVPSGEHLSLPSDLVIVYSISKKTHNILLVKKKLNSVDRSKIVKMSSADWESEVSNSNSQDTQFVVMENMLLADVSNSIENSIDRVPNNVRFISVDKKSLAFDPRSPLYQGIMKNDFKVNICCGGVCGSLRNTSITENVKQNNNICYDGTTKIASIKSSIVDIKAIGTNFSEPVNPPADSKMHALEFAGVKNGKLIYGICRIKDGILMSDPILFWNIPSNWTPQQAATVPLHYSMAYYILIKRCLIKKGQLVFIHAGYSLLSQAVIRVALSVGCRVLTTYTTTEQLNYIMSTFPELSKQDVVHSKKSHFGNELMTSTNGRGAEVIINTMGTEYLEYTQQLIFDTDERLIGAHFIQVDKEPLKDDFSLGMYTFNNLGGMYGVVFEEILELSNEDKQLIKSSIDEGVKTGVVKPFDLVAVEACQAPSEIQVTAINATKTVPEKKLVISFDKSAKSARSCKNFKNSILLIGSQSQMSLCYDVISNYISKAYRKFHLLIDKDVVSPIVSRRFRSLQKRNADLSLEFHPSRKLNSPQDCENLIKHIQEDSKLEYVYYILSDDECPSHHVDSALRKYAKDCMLVAVGKSVYKLGEIRKKDGYNSIIFLPSPKMASRIIIHGIDKMISQRNSSVDTLCLNDPHNRVSDQPKMLKDRLPEDIDELLDLYATERSEKVFLPLSTKGPDYKLLKDASPLFMLPGLRIQKQMDFVSSLTYPVFMITLPSLECNNIYTLAHIISREVIEEFPDLEVINILCEGWSGVLAIALAHSLELRGKLCFLIMLDAAPSIVQRSLDSANDLYIISKYFNISQEMTEKLECMSSWDDRVATILQLPECSDYNKEILKTCLLLLKERIMLHKQFVVSSFRIKGRVILFTLKSESSKFDCGNIQMACSTEVKVIQVDSDDILCQSTVDIILAYPGHQNDVTEPKKRSIEELTTPLYITDITVKPMQRTVTRMQHNRDVNLDVNVVSKICL